MRVKVALTIIIVTFSIITLNLLFNLFMTHQSLSETMDNDISFALDIANDLVSTRMHLFEADAQIIADWLLTAQTPDEMETIMREQLELNPDFLSLTVFNRNGVLAGYGDSQASAGLLTDGGYLNRAFRGMTSISTTMRSEGNNQLVMYVCTPIDRAHVLSATVSGMVFSDLLDKYRLWNNGNILMLDSEGTIIAHFFFFFLESRSNYAIRPDVYTPPDTVEFFNGILANDKGLGQYEYGGILYKCAYMQIKSIESDWYLILSVPIAESPLTMLQNRLVIMAAFSFILCCTFALLLSNYVSKAYIKISEQNVTLETLNEITRMQADKIRFAHQRTKMMMDAVPICSMLWDLEGNIFDCNEESVRVFGTTGKQELIARFFEFSPKHQPSGLLSRELAKIYLAKTFDEGKCVFEWMHKLADGEPFPCEMTLVRINYGDSNIVAAYLNDLRKHKKMLVETLRLHAELRVALKDAQDSNLAKSNFLASMSHEMRTPLNAVVGLSELALGSGTVQGETEDRLDKIHTSGMTLLGLVNDILDISKIESGRFELHPVEYETPSLINDIVSLNIMRIADKPISFKLIVDDMLPEKLLGDDLRVKQIFNNLLTNAFKYTMTGSVEWKITHRREGVNIWLISDVTDTGIGIKQEDIQKLFVDYSKLDADMNRKTEGTGLGLSITKRLVEMMEGEITVKSVYGEGSVFSVRIRQQFVLDTPIGATTAESLMNARYTAAKRSLGAVLARINLSYARILVVDDVITNLDVIKGMLKPYGATVECAMSGKQAIDMIRQEGKRYDAIFMDHMMPEMDGIETAHIIMDDIKNGKVPQTPIIALTANAIAGNEQMFLDKGFQAFISKPIDIMLLDSILKKWVRDKSRESGAAFIDTPTQTRVQAHIYAQTQTNALTQTQAHAPASAPAPETEAPVSKDIKIVAQNREGDVYTAEENIKETHIINNEKANAAVRMDFMESVAVDDLDVKAGLGRFFGDTDSYMDVLRSYLISTRAILDSMGKRLAAGNLRDFSINAHGVKGSSYGVGAFRAGRDAETLERLAKEGEAEQVYGKYDEFVLYMDKFLNSINDMYLMFQAQKNKPIADRPDRALLEQICAACEAYDINKVDALMSRLESFEYKNGNEMLNWLRIRLDNMDFSQIAECDWIDGFDNIETADNKIFTYKDIKSQ